MINVTSCKDGEEVSVTLAGTKEEVICEAAGVMVGLAERTFKNSTGRVFDQATNQERVTSICAAYNGMFIRFALENELYELASELLLLAPVVQRDICKRGDEE